MQVKPRTSREKLYLISILVAILGLISVVYFLKGDETNFILNENVNCDDRDAYSIILFYSEVFLKSFFTSFPSLFAVFIPTFIILNYKLLENKLQKIKFPRGIKALECIYKPEVVNFFKFEVRKDPYEREIFITLIAHISALILALGGLGFEILSITSQVLENHDNVLDLATAIIAIASIIFFFPVLSAVVSGNLANTEAILVLKKYVEEEEERNMVGNPPFESKSTFYRFCIVVLANVITWWKIVYLNINTNKEPNFQISKCIDLREKLIFIIVNGLILLILYWIHTKNLKIFRKSVQLNTKIKKFDEI